MKKENDTKNNIKNKKIPDSPEHIHKKRKLQNKVLKKIVENLNGEGVETSVNKKEKK
jgi:hypothetical protein